MPRTTLLAFALLAVVPLSGCSTWQTVDTDPAQLVAGERPERVRVTRMDGEQLILEAPEVRAGALVATAAPGAVLLQNIRVLEVRAVSVVRTVAFLLPGVALVAIIGKESCRC